MRKLELLAPAGDKESLIAAVQNGADAIYLGGKLFNARAFAKNFDDEELKWAVEYAHLHFVKIYITVNTLYCDQEFEELITYIDDLYDIQVDALIVQDIGLFHVIKARYPDFEIHMSTQASIMSLSASQYFEKMGASRVVLARENTIEEIRHICQNTQLEIEVFVHGALCICYSGQCLMSSFIGKRSGNRGQCAQPCRLQYRLKKDKHILESKYPFLLSPKDLMTIEHVGELIDAGVTSFKIEGRMKKPEYVASVVKAYRHAIDAYINKKKINLQNDIHDMRAMFNRDYTTGYIFHDQNLVKGDYSGNKGIIIGKVKYYQKHKKRVGIILNETLHQGDSVVFEKIDKGRPINKIYIQEKLVSQAHRGMLIEIDFDYPVYEGNVRRTGDIQLKKTLIQTYDKEYRKVPLSMHFVAKIGEPAILTIQCRQFYVIQKSTLCVERALKTSLGHERIYQQLSKIGTTPFVINNIKIDIDKDISLPIKALNELRREAIGKLVEKLSHRSVHYAEKSNTHSILRSCDSLQQKIYVLTSNLAQLQAVMDLPIDYIYYPYQSDSYEAYQICQKYHKKMGLFLPRICKEKEIEDIRQSNIYRLVDDIIVNEYGALYAFKEKNQIVGTGLNIYNSYASDHIQKSAILSLEMNKEQLQSIRSSHHNCVQIYGKIENMISDYCPITQHYFGYQKKNCNLCHNATFSIIDRKNKEFPIMTDEKCRMHLLNCYALFIEPKEVQQFNVFLHFTNENSNITKFICQEVCRVLNSQKKTRIKENIETTSGYFKYSL